MGWALAEPSLLVSPTKRVQTYPKSAPKVLLYTYLLINCIINMHIYIPFFFSNRQADGTEAKVEMIKREK